MDIRNSKRYMLALAIHRAPHLRPDEKLLLWDLVDDERSLSLLSHSGLEESIGRSLRGRPWRPRELLALAAEDAEYLERSGAAYAHYDDPGYPAALRETARPPFGLFYRGAILDGESPAVAVVGTRCPTGKGLSAAILIAGGLARAGLPVVSGLARGIDAAAHRGALAAGRAVGSRGANSSRGATCAVLPCGIDRVYPPANRDLASAILEGGGILVSEYPPGEDLRTFRFPERNRIIAGMARACVVVEAPAKSGALITADHALDEGRDVWVARACLGGPRGAGIDRLAMEGAGILDSADDILADFANAGAAGIGGAIRENGANRVDKKGTDAGGENGAAAVAVGRDDPRDASRGRDALKNSEGRRLAALLGEELES
jgi:DNA processing protein